MKFKNLLWGMLAGLFGSLAGAFILWGSWLLPSLGLLLSKVNLVQGTVALIALGLLGGGIYGLVLGERKLRLYATLLTGLLLGFILWLLGVLILVPLILGLPPQIGSPLDHWIPLVAFIFYGLIVSLLYSRWSRHQSRRRVYYAAALLLISGLLTPLMLRAAISTDPAALDLPGQYRAEVIAKGFTFPTSIAMDDENNIYIAEAGYSYGPKETPARVLKVGPKGDVGEIMRGFEGPINGLAYKEGCLFVSHRGKITEVKLKTGKKRDLVTGLPSLGDHQNNDLMFGCDGALYFGQGTATNAGVVGSDNFVYAWADRYPEFHDVPSRGYTLKGENYESLNLKTVNPTDTRSTGAFAPYGTPRQPDEKLAGKIPASGAIHRLDMECNELTVYADGLRNPYGLAMSPEGTMYATNLGYDDRGVRAVAGSPDWVVKLKEGAWYGWPDFAGTTPISAPQFASDRGVNRNPLIADPPKVEPPLATLPPHYSPMKLAWSPADFMPDALLVAVFGDGQPLTEDLRKLVPSGVIRINPQNGTYSWFARNKGEPRAGRTGGGFKRVVDVKFSEDNCALYILDFGVMEFTDLAPNAIPNTGVLWKISKK